MNNGQIGSYYDNAYLNYDAGRLSKQSGQKNGVLEGVGVNLPAADNAVVQASDSASEMQDMTAGQFVSNALKEAGLAQNDKTMQLVQVLLLQQQPVDKNTLTMFNRIIKMFPDTDVQTIVNMKLNNIPVNKEMIMQYEQYRSNANYIMKDLIAIADGFGDMLSSLNMSAGKEAAVAQLENIVAFVKNMTYSAGTISKEANSVQQEQEDISVEEAIRKQTGSDKVENKGQVPNQSMEKMQTARKGSDETINSEKTGRTGQIGWNGDKERVIGSGIADIIQRDNAAVPDKKLHYEQFNELKDLMQEISELSGEEKKTDGTFFEKLTDTFKQMPYGTEDELFKLLDRADTKKVIKGELEQVLLLEPKDAAELEKVQKYYKKLKSALDNYVGMAEKQTETLLSDINKTFQNMSENLNFMRYVNEMMPYVQLPLKLLDENAHGDFYVIHNKKEKTESQDEFTAFLRLDMEFLGGLDVFIRLKNSLTDISFKAESDEICEFINKNTGYLKDRLESKGYTLMAHIEKRKEDFSLVKDIIEGEKSGIIEKYSFNKLI